MRRELSDRERGVIAALVMLGHVDPAHRDSVTRTQRRAWYDQIASTGAGETCPCGLCPSIQLVTASWPAPIAAGSAPRRVVLSAAVPDALLLLFIAHGKLDYLELAPLDNRARWAEFPLPRELVFG